jgi:hypothetical protein
MIARFKPLLAAAVVAAFFAFGSQVSAETAKQPVGQVSIDETQFGFIVGGSVGRGVLTYEGKEHPFKLEGVSLGANIGVSKLSAVGDVFDMTSLEQFEGIYAKVTGSLTLGGGKGVMMLQNQNGVTMQLKGTTQGIELNVGSSGVTVRFVQ